MGLFGSKKTYVSSSIYNMAGDINQRPNFLKTVITNHMLGNGGSSIVDTLRQSYIAGPGMKLRKFARWAAAGNYPAIGVGQANLYTTPEVSEDLILPLVPHDDDQTVNIQKLEMKTGDYSYWAEQWMLEHYPELIGSKWTSNFDETSGEIHIVMQDGTSVAFTPTGFSPTERYFFVLYNLIRAAETGSWVTGTTYAGVFPSVTGWTTVSNVATTDTRTLSRIVTTTKKYSDGRPDEVTVVNTTSSDSYTYFRGVYEKTNYIGSPNDPTMPDQLYSVKSKLFLNRDGYIVENETSTSSDEELEDGRLVCTTIVDTIQEALSVQTTYRTDTQEITRQTFSASKLLIYKLGSGVSPALDAKVYERSQDGYYLPFIPVRLNNVMVDNGHFPDLYEQNKKAYKKLTGLETYDKDLKESITSSKDLKEMDYVYVMLGVSLNTKSNSAKTYLFDFFERLRLTQTAGAPTAYTAWNTKQTAFTGDISSWLHWRLAQSDPDDVNFGSAMPSTGTAYSMPTNEIHIRGNGTATTNMDMTISWSSISRTVGVGKYKPDSKVGDCYVEYGARDTYTGALYLLREVFETASIGVDHISIVKQIDDNNWASLDIVGLTHKNNIYGGKFVEISARAALNDQEESGFLVPIHYETYKAMSLVDATQMSMACAYMVVNSYQVVKKGFFQSFFFKIFAVIVVVALTVFVSPFAGALASALFAITTGFDPLGIPMALVTRVLALATTAVFGEKAGRIIANLIVVAAQIAAAVMSGDVHGVNAVLRVIAKPENLAKIGMAIGNGIAGNIQQSAIEEQQKTEKLVKDYGKEVLRISDLYAKNIGTDRAELDPLAILGQRGIQELSLYESPDAFLERTLLTGGEIAEISMSVVSNFTEATLATTIKI